jgi:hypothetical protein
MTYKDDSVTKSVLSIAKSDIYLSPSSFSPGDRFLIIDSRGDAKAAVKAGLTGPDTDPVLRGSYSWDVKGAPTQPSSGAMDITGTLQILEETNQNMYGIGVHERRTTSDYNAGNYPPGSHIVGNDETGDMWVDLVGFLEETKDTNMKTFAVLGKPTGIGNDYTDAWGHKGGYWGSVYEGTADEDLYHTQCPAEHPDAGCKKYALAAQEMSRLSLTYPNFIGFSIDDFPTHVLNRANCSYGRGHVATIQAGAASHNPDFEFWPTHYVGHALETAIPSNRIGFTYGMPTTASEFVAAEHDFRIPKAIKIESAELNFLHRHTRALPVANGFDDDGTGNYYGHDIPDVFKGCFVNGNIVLDETISWDKRIQAFSQDITSHLQTGTNKLRFVISGSSTDVAANGDGRNKFRVFSYGDIMLKITYRTKTGSRRKITLGQHRRKLGRVRRLIGPPVFSVNSGTIDNHHLHYKYNALSPSSAFGTTDNPGRIVAETNVNYQYLQDCAGALCYYPNHTGTIMNDTGRIFEAYRRHLPTKRLIHGQQGFLYEKDRTVLTNTPPHDPQIRVGTHVSKFKKAGSHTDGMVVWNLPVDLLSGSSGIFSERRAPDYDEDATSGTGFTIRSQFLSNHLARMGHYQRFVTKVPYGPGTLNFDLNRLHAAAIAVSPQREITKVLFSSDTKSDYGAASGANYIIIHDGDTRYNLWFNDGSGDSAPSADGTEQQVDISSTGNTSEAVAAQFHSIVNGMAGFSSNINPNNANAIFVSASTQAKPLAISSVNGTLSGITISQQQIGLSGKSNLAYRIYPSGTTNYLFENTHYTGGLGSHQVSSIALTASHKITIETSAHHGYGTHGGGTSFSCSFHETARNIDIPLSRSAFDFESWTTSSYLYNIQKDITDYFAEVGASAASYNNYILQLREDGVTWKIVPPSDGARVYVESLGASMVYNERRLTWARETDMLTGLLVTGSTGLIVEHHILRKGRCAFIRGDSSQAITFNSSLLSSSIVFDTTGAMDPISYEKSTSDMVKIKNNGKYSLRYDLQFKNTGSAPFAAPTGSLKAYFATSSAIVSDPAPPFVLSSSLRSAPLIGVSGTISYAMLSARTIMDLKAGDEIKLYAEREIIPHYSNVTGTVGTQPGAALMIIDRIGESG